MSEDKKSLINLVPDSVDNAVKNITDKPTQNIGTTFADIWYLVFGGISQAAERRKLKYSYALQEFEKELKEKISKIPEDKLLEADTQIVAPALEASKYCIEKEELRHMFVNLISSSFNSDMSNFLHPIFPDILKQLSSEEAKFLQEIYYADDHKFYRTHEPNQYLSLTIFLLRQNNLISSNDNTHSSLDIYFYLTPLGLAFCMTCIDSK